MENKSILTILTLNLTVSKDFMSLSLVVYSLGSYLTQ